MRFTAPLAALALLLGAGPASADDYPPPHQSKPAPETGHSGGRHHTLRVCHHGRHRIRTISRAVRRAAAGDTIRVCAGVYREGVRVPASKRRLKLVGDVHHPSRVVIESKGLKGAAAQNGIMVDGADAVTVEGFYARHYKANGFFFVNVTGYRVAHVLAGHGGAYGVFAFNSKGGTMTRSQAFYNADSGFYVGQTPRQAKPRRTTVSHVSSWGNEVGFSGTNMRYVTIKRSRWFNNGLGIVPSTLDTEKLWPEEHNTIVDNDVFWNNWNYFAAAPFTLKHSEGVGGFDYPIGSGVLLLGGRHNTVRGNRIFGNWLTGAGAVEQVVMLTSKNAAERRAAVLVGNEIRGNAFGLGGADLNGRDLFYDGEGHDNCVDPAETGVRLTSPADRSTLGACPHRGANAFSQATLTEGLGWVLAKDHELAWIRHPHKPRAGIRPLVICTLVKGEYCKGQPRL